MCSCIPFRVRLSVSLFVQKMDALLVSLTCALITLLLLHCISCRVRVRQLEKGVGLLHLVNPKMKEERRLREVAEKLRWTERAGRTHAEQVLDSFVYHDCIAIANCDRELQEGTGGKHVQFQAHCNSAFLLHSLSGSAETAWVGANGEVATRHRGLGSSSRL